MSHLSISVVVHDRAYGPIDWEFLPVNSETRQLSVLVRKVAALEQRIIRRTNPRHKVASAEGRLFGLGEILVDIPVEL